MRIIRSFVFCFVLFNFISCASVGFGEKNLEERAVLKRAHEFRNSIEKKNPKATYALLSPKMRSEVSEKEFVAVSEVLYLNIVQIENKNFEVVWIRNNVALTQVETSHRFQPIGSKFSDCERDVWIKLSNKWFLADFGRSCNYLLDANDIEFLTNDLK